MHPRGQGRIFARPAHGGRQARGAEGFLVHLGDHDWVLSGFAAARCVAYLRDYAKRSFGTLPEARFNALRNYVGSRVSYMRLYQAIAQGRADALVASVVKA